MKENRNVSIQILRVCACLMVFIVHFGQIVNFTGTIRAFTDFGAMGVHLFFLITGFLACGTFWDNPNLNTKQYYLKRMIALLPLYYLVIAFYFVTENILNFIKPTIIPPDELGLRWFRYIFCLSGFLSNDHPFWTNLGGTWTIPIFLFFYLLAPFTLRKVRSVRASIFLWFAVYVITQVLDSFYTCSIFSHLHYLYLGTVLYACTRKGYSLTGAILFACLAICMLIIKHTTYAYVAIFSVVFLIAVSIEHIRLPDWVLRTINALDSYSYTVYLIHCAFFRSLLTRLDGLNTPKIILAILAIVGTPLSTWIVGRYIEKPIQRWLRKRILK